MDLAIYISELLGQRGELRISGVGYFEKARVDGYYNDQEHTFYPPGYQVKFNPELTADDDSLAEYIAGKKNISLLSAKYFVDKYLGSLKQEIQKQEVELADLGALYTADAQFLFKPRKILTEYSPEFYGFQPVKAYGINERPAAAHPPVIADTSFGIPPEEINDHHPADQEELLTDQPVSKSRVFSPHDQEQELQYMEEEIRKPNLPVIILFAITIAGLIFFGIYLYNPALFGVKEQSTAVVKPVDNPKPKPVVASSTDSSKAPVNGQTTKAPVPAQPVATTADTMNKKHYELMGGAFKTKSQINVAVKNYESLGLHPRILEHATGRLYKITLGTYFNQSDAVKAQDSISKATKIKKTSILIQPINPKK